MEMLGDDDHVETGLLGSDGMTDEHLGLKLLVSEEVGELRHVVLRIEDRDDRGLLPSTAGKGTRRRRRWAGGRDSCE